MAEYVQFRTEETIPELEELQRIDLFQPLEIKSVIKRRKELEYKIERKTKCKEDYLLFIRFEISLLQLIKIRRKKTGKDVKKKEIEFAIRNRIEKLFSQAVQRFKDDIKLWLSYIKFCQDIGRNASVSRIIVQMLAVHNNKPHLWKMAADWEFDVCHSIENSRKFLQRSLRFHPDSQLLYKEAFHLELKHSKKEHDALLEKEQEILRNNLVPPERPENPILDCRVAEVVYNCACDVIKDIQFSLDCFALAEKYDFTRKLQDKIIRNAASSNWNSVELWDFLAKRALAGLPVDPSLLGEKGKDLKTSVTEETNKRDRLLAGVALYEMAVKEVPTEAMWSAYLTSMSKKQELSQIRSRLLRKAYENAHNAGFMQERFYVKYVMMLEESDEKDKALTILTKSVKRYPLSYDLWLYLMQWYLNSKDTEKAAAVLEHAITNLDQRDDRMLPFWVQMIQHYCQTTNKGAEALFRRGLALCTQVSQQLKPVYLDWLLVTKGIEITRTGYEAIVLQPPLSLELHMKMVEIEMAQKTIDAKAVRRCFDLATHQFGPDSVDLWLQYARFEVTDGKSRKSSSVYQRAINTLKPALVDHFVAEFTLHRCGAEAGTVASNE